MRTPKIGDVFDVTGYYLIVVVGRVRKTATHAKVIAVDKRPHNLHRWFKSSWDLWPYVGNLLESEEGKKLFQEILKCV